LINPQGKLRGMDDKVFVDWDQSLAAVKFKGHWRFFYDTANTTSIF